MTEKLVGVNSVLEALKGKRRIHRIFIQEGRTGKRIEQLLTLARQKGVYSQYVEKRKLDQMYNLGNHQGVIAQVDSYSYSTLEDILDQQMGGEPLLLILDGIEDPRNLGSIIRTAECAGAHGIIIPRHNSAEINATVIRASAGAAEHLPIAQETNLVNCIKELKERGLWIIGADMDGSDYFDCPIPSPTAIVIGGEGKGIRRLVRAHCDMLVKIPMSGVVNSLNASVAAGIIIYEAVRQRRLQQKHSD